MNWGYKIVLVYLVFISGMLFMAFKSSEQDIELVTEDYYAKELVYQQKIDEIKRTASLSKPIEVNFNQQILTITFPDDFAAKKIKGSVTLYCPSNKKMDIQRSFDSNEKKVVVMIPVTKQGLHYVKLSWSAEGISYYFEKKIII